METEATSCSIFLKVDSSAHFARTARAFHALTVNVLIFCFPFVCHILPSPISVNFPIFSSLPFVCYYSQENLLKNFC